MTSLSWLHTIIRSGLHSTCRFVQASWEYSPKTRVLKGECTALSSSPFPSFTCHQYWSLTLTGSLRMSTISPSFYSRIMLYAKVATIHMWLIQVNKIKNTKKHLPTPCPQPTKLLNRTKHIWSVEKSLVASDYRIGEHTGHFHYCESSTGQCHSRGYFCIAYI